MSSKTNKFRIMKSYIIGYTTNTNKKFYIDKEDYEKIKNFSWYEQKNGYIVHKGKEYYLLHRFIIDAPKGILVDHINHNKKDNRKSNLRLTDYKGNGMNRKKEPKCITKIHIGNNFYYVIQYQGNYIGCYKKYQDAKNKREELLDKRKELFGRSVL